MIEAVNFSDSLAIFQNVIVLYKDDNGDTYISNTWFYDRKGNLDYMSILYKTPLPKLGSVIEGWNYLDDNDPHVTLVPQASMETGVEDFLYYKGLEKNWKSIEYVVIKSYPELDSYIKKHPLNKGDVIGFGIKKK